jgi:hypothetical protein
MTMTTTRSLSVTFGAAVLLLGALGARAEEGKDVDWKAKAVALWQSSCHKCHTAPDVRFETDRGFLAQVTETS